MTPFRKAANLFRKDDRQDRRFERLATLLALRQSVPVLARAQQRPVVLLRVVPDEDKA